MADPNVALGLVCKHYLERIVEGQSPVEALSSTEKTFPTCICVKSDLEKGFEFWQQLFKAVESLEKSQSITANTFNMFADANQWLNQNKF
ncbi:MAG: hypothetical protein JSY10_27085 [Paenibacillus sp.]|nr:hypothetical protein [Paenibacillus sp.]